VIRPVVVIVVIVWVAWFVAQLVKVLAWTAWWLVSTPIKALLRWRRNRRHCIDQLKWQQLTYYRVNK
jgi:cobalamin biosynthesis protein CobD/CbiB